MILRTYIIVFFIICYSSLSFSQTKVQELYESKKYEKCIKLCNKNLDKNIDKYPSILYKSMSLIASCDQKSILKDYPEAVYEALKGVKRLENYFKKYPKNSFLSGNKRKIKFIVDRSLEKADTLYCKGEFKRSSKIYKKLIEIYPNNKLYIYKLAMVFDFDNQTTLIHITDMSYEELHKAIYDVVSNSLAYLKKNGKRELEYSLEKLYENEDCNIEVASYLLVFLKENYASSVKAEDLIKKFSNKYWQIDMLIKVNEKRKTGVICGEEKMESKPPLVLENCLLRTSQKYAELMFKERHFSHTGPDGKSPWTRANEEGCHADGENIALGSNQVSGALSQWIGSPGHCKNIMGYHTYMGIGEAGSYWVQMFR